MFCALIMISSMFLTISNRFHTKRTNNSYNVYLEGFLFDALV